MLKENSQLMPAGCTATQFNGCVTSKFLHNDNHEIHCLTRTSLADKNGTIFSLTIKLFSKLSQFKDPVRIAWSAGPEATKKSDIKTGQWVSTVNLEVK